MSNIDQPCAAIYVGAKTIYTSLPVETQIAYFNEIIEKQKLKSAGVYVDTEEDPSSPDYQKAFKIMLQDAKAHGFDRVFCASCSAIDKDPIGFLHKISSSIAAVSPDFSFYFAIEDLDTADERFSLGASFMTTMWKEFEAHQRRANAICRAEQDYKGHPLIDFLCDDLLDNP